MTTPFWFEEIEPEPGVAYLVRLADYPHPAPDAVKVAEQRTRANRAKAISPTTR
jgi:hypothetical protein